MLLGVTFVSVFGRICLHVLFWCFRFLTGCCLLCLLRFCVLVLRFLASLDGAVCGFWCVGLFLLVLRCLHLG